MDGFDANSTLGALTIGVCISCVLFGIVTVQCFIYFANFPDDRVTVKALVVVVWLMELGHSISICHSLYILTITHYGHPEALVRTPDSLCVAIIFEGITGPLVQAFFAHRVWVVGKKIWIPLFCWLLSAFRLVASFLAAIEGFKMVTLAQYESDWKWLLTTILAVGAAVDVTVALSLCYYLSKQKRNSVRSTERMIDMIIVWTIQTGLITSVSAVAMLIFFVAMGDNFIWLTFFMFLARLFSNSLLASLNSRKLLRALNAVELTSLKNTTYSGTVFGPAIRMHTITEKSSVPDVTFGEPVRDFIELETGFGTSKR